MGEQKGVDTAGSAGQVDGRVGEGGAQRASDDAGQVHQQQPPPAVHHFQRHSQRQLHEQVGGQVDVPFIHNRHQCKSSFARLLDRVDVADTKALPRARN